MAINCAVVTLHDASLRDRVVCFFKAEWLPSPTTSRTDPVPRAVSAVVRSQQINTIALTAKFN